MNHLFHSGVHTLYECSLSADILLLNIAQEVLPSEGYSHTFLVRIESLTAIASNHQNMPASRFSKTTNVKHCLGELVNLLPYILHTDVH